MKPLLPWLAALLAALAGCHPAAPDDPTPPSTVAATVSGEPDFLAPGVPAGNAIYVADTDTATAPGRLSLLALSPAGASIRLLVARCGGVGTYPLRADPTATRYVSSAAYLTTRAGLDTRYYTEYLQPAGAVVGQVVVTDFDRAGHRVRGTFSFTATQVQPSGPVGAPLQVSNGRFDIYNLTVYQ